MRWLVSLFLVAAVLAGCNSPGPTYDPFLGRTTIPPPGTGQISPGTAVPYYQSTPAQGGQSSVTPRTAAQQVAATTSSGQGAFDEDMASRLLETPAEREYRVGRLGMRRQPNTSTGETGGVEWDEPAQTASNEHSDAGLNWQSPSAHSDAQVAVYETQNTAAATSATVSGVQPTQAAVTTQAILAQHAAPTGTAAATPSPSQIIIPSSATVTQPAAGPGQLVTQVTSPATAPAGAPAANPPVEQRPAPYGYADDYSWLKGKLEYLSSKQQWKLRYIPIDGQTDEYGGSVVIDNQAAVASYKAGDFVAVEGTLDPSTTGPGSFAPSYRVSRTKSQQF